MAAALPPIQNNAARAADIAPPTSTKPPGGRPTSESFKSKLEEARKPSKPKHAEHAPSAKHGEKTVKAKGVKPVVVAKKRGGGAEANEEEAADHESAEHKLDAAKDSTQEQGGSKHDDLKEGTDTAAHQPVAENGATVNTPTLVIEQQAVAASQQKVAKNSATPQTGPTPQPPVPTITQKPSKPPAPTKQTVAAHQMESAQASAQSAKKVLPAGDLNESQPDPMAPVSKLMSNPKGGPSAHNQGQIPASNEAASPNDPSSTAQQPPSSSGSAFSDIVASLDKVQSFTDTPIPVQSTAKPTSVDPSDAGLTANTASPTSPVSGTSSVRSANAPPTPQATFNIENHPKIVQSVQTTLLSNGGTMRIRLDPPELGVLQVSINVRNGVTTASFETSNDQATKLLSHSMGQLKQALEAQGVTVGKMHVQQSPRDQSAGNQNGKEDDTPHQPQDDTARQEQQRKDAMQRMWRRLSVGSDPLDLVA